MPRPSRQRLTRGGRRVLALTGLIVATAPAAALASPGEHDARGDAAVIGHVYLDANTAPANSIAVLDRHPDGSLTADPASPAPAGGAGLGTGLPSRAPSPWPTTAASCSRSTPAATRCRCSGSAPMVN